MSTRRPEKNPFVGLWRSARCGRLSSREVWASTSFRSSSRQRLHWAGPGSIAPCAMCGWLRASETECVRASAVNSCAHALLDSPARTLIGILNSLCCPTFCESAHLLADSPNRDIRINAKSLGVCFIGVKGSRLHWAGSSAL